jgi:hypothetical protein
MKTATRHQDGFLHLQTLIPLVVVALAIGGIGSYVLKKSQAAKPSSSATGTIWVTQANNLSSPFSVEFSYSKSAKQLKRPFIQFECYRDVDGDGKINSTAFSNSADLVYSYQSYLLDSWHHPDYPVTITSSGTAGFTGTASANLLSGSSKLVSEKGDAQCSASLQEWGTNLRQETYPIIYQTTPLVPLQDLRLNK